MAANDFKNTGDASIRLLDGKAGTPNSLTLLGVEDGGVSFGSTRERGIVFDRSVAVARTKARKLPTTININTTFKEWKSRTTAPDTGAGSSIRDFMLGLFTDAESVADGGDFEFNFEYTLSASGSAADQQEVITYTRCTLDADSFQQDPEMSKISFTIVSLDTDPTVVRS